MAFISVVPAYGRDYKSQAEVQKDWDDNKDFKCVGVGQYGYINKPDWEKYAPDDSIIVRYAKGKKVYTIKGTINGED